jgi:hypothetical protein
MINLHILMTLAALQLKATVPATRNKALCQCLASRVLQSQALVCNRDHSQQSLWKETLRHWAVGNGCIDY